MGVDLTWGLSKPILSEIQKMKLTQLTDVQLQAIPHVLKGENTLVIAPTGTGKTEAAMLPVFDSFIRQKNAGLTSKGISILYITPLRALNRDLLRRITQLGADLNVKIAVRHGDTELAARRKLAVTPPDMLITTPESFQAILAGRRMKLHLQAVKWIIIDEIHELVTNKRGIQLALGLERLQALMNRSPQRIGLSATVGNPNIIAKFLVGENRRVTVVQTDISRGMEIHVESPATTGSDEHEAEKLMVPAGMLSRLRRILEHIQANRSTLVFVNTREHAESLGSKLRLVAPQLKLGLHHGSLSKDIRINTEKQLKEGELQAVICTSSLELGIDIGFMDYVIQYMSPRQTTRLVQRIGRSGHIITAKPRGCIIAAWPDDVLESAVLARRALNNQLEEPEIHYNALDVLAHQIAGLLLDYSTMTVKQVHEIATKTHPYHDLPAEDVFGVADQLERQGIIRRVEDYLMLFPTRTRQYYYDNLSMITDIARYVVFENLTQRKIGLLDEEFVARNGKPGSQFILHGNVWQILQVDDERGVVEVMNVEPSMAAIPSWEGEIIPVPYEAAQEVGMLRREISETTASGGDPWRPLEGYPLRDDAKEKIISTIQRQLQQGFIIPHDKRIVVECLENYTIIHGCFGDKVNQTLNRILATLTTAKTGVEIGIQSDAYRLALISPYPLDAYFVKEIISSLTAGDVRRILDSSLDKTNLFLWRLWHNVRRFGTISKEAVYKTLHARRLLMALMGTPIYRETLRELYVENFDAPRCEETLDALRKGEITVEVQPHQDEFSPLALPMADKIVPHDLIQPVRERHEIVTLLEERLMAKSLKFICIFKGDWKSIYTIRSLKEKIQCPRCHSTLIAATYLSDHDCETLVKKKLSKRKLTSEEEKKWLTLWRSASLIQNYGRKAALTISARGVGPTTAVRILQQQYRTKDDFLLAILKAERDYLRTRMFWD